MKIYTRRGDQGSTSLGDGSRVSKAADRVCACGDVDELNSVVGVLIADGVPASAGEHLTAIQANLFEVGAFLADPTGRYRVPPAVREPRWLEQWIDEMQGELDPLHGFILPGGCRGAALAHHARAVCRRAERRVVGLMEGQDEVAVVLPLLNRLSDTLFVLARWLNRHADTSDVPWHSRN